MKNTTELAYPFGIKLGRIGKNLEGRMGISLCSDIGIYMLDAMADTLARQYPDSYLTLIEEISLAIKKPDAVSFSLNREELLFIRLYPSQGELFALTAKVRHQGKPKKWLLVGVCAHKDLSELKRDESEPFFRL